MKITIPFELDSARRHFFLGGEPMVFHCHHYNTFLQRSIQDASYIDSAPYLIGAGAEVAFAQLTKVFSEASTSSVEERKELAQEIYQWAGFGIVNMNAVTASGGLVTSPSSHYAMAWKSKFGSQTNPVCHFASGWLAGAMAAIFDKPAGSFSVSHTMCSCTSKDDECVFSLEAGEPNYEVFTSVAAGLMSDAHSQHAVPSNNVDYEGIHAALTGMDIVGNDEGIIPAFGVYLTRHYANYYNRVSFETERAMQKMFGDPGLAAAKPLFVEAGHVCAFNTFGGIMTSSEWDALILPSLKTKEDWVHGITAAVNALGWGRWQVTELSEDSANFVIHDDYESVGYLGMYGKSDHPVSHLAEGAAIGIMNLVYRGNVESRPAFTPEFYDELFKGEGNYTAECISSRAMGDDVTEFRVFR